MSAKSSTESGIEPHSSTPEEKQKKESSYLIPVLMLLGVILVTLSTIIAGYFHGHMHIESVYKSLHS
jgi:hypothetical protein|tara:strand:- start:176 stop:376 length:201 start_codon:yes stop_codon:yes gene_type:complete